MDSAGSERPQRSMALVGRELDRYRIEIAVLIETRFAEVGGSKKLVLASHSSGVDAKVR